MDRNSKQDCSKPQQKQQQQQQQEAVMKHDQATAAALQQSLASVSPSQLHFFQTTPHSSASSVPLPWMIPPYQMMVLPQGMSQSFFAQNVLALQDGHVLVAPTMDEANGGQV